MSQAREFVRRVRRAMEKGDETATHQAIEISYEQCIVDHSIAKSDFMKELLAEDAEVFALTMDHLFTPINWSAVKLRVLWGIRNEATGNLLTLERDLEADVYHLKESSDDPAVLDFAPMFTGNQEDAETFVRMLSELPTDAPLGVGESIVTLRIDEKINVTNLKAVVVKIIF